LAKDWTASDYGDQVSADDAVEQLAQAALFLS